jgi:alpha-L-arabinofuranosidase
MRRMGLREAVYAVIVLSCSLAVFAESTITVSVDQPGAPVAKTMWGLFYEDINFGADGGLYSELVKNRSFEFDEPMMGWTTLGGKGAADVVMKNPYDEKNPRALRLMKSGPGQAGVSNEGFRGMGIQQGRTYWFSVYAMRTGAPAMLRIEVVGAKGDKLMEGTIDNVSGDWKNYTVQMRATATEAKAKLNVYLDGDGSVDLDMVSLFAADTAMQMNGRPVPGLRKDLVRMLSDLKPGFLRFPGGCIVEGITLHDRYQWKHTVGDINDRKLNFNRWNNVFKHRLTPDYFQSYGLGFYEFFLLSKQIGAEPLPILNCGMACQFLTGETVAVGSLTPYVQDALDLIEFANGPVDSTWGRLRAQMGHPEPFGLKILGIGNEQWGPQYIERYRVFDKAIREKYPEIKLVGSAGSDPYYFPNGVKEIEYLWSELRKLKADFVDEHFYASTEWFIENATRYDAYERTGPRVFVGEYAARGGKMDPDMRNMLGSALAEAAFMTGLERNADLVTMSAYAPLFAHVDAWQWTPNLIWFDNLTVAATPNYYVQQMFSINRGDVVLPVKSAEKALLVSAVRDGKDVVVKVVNPTGQAIETSVDLQGVSTVSGGKVTVLAGALNDRNTIDEPTKITPVTEPLKADGAAFGYTFRPYSLTVLRVCVEK